MFGLISTIFVGFVVGVIARLIMPGKENIGMIMTTILGIIGSPVQPTRDNGSAGTRPAKVLAGLVRSSARLP